MRNLLKMLTVLLFTISCEKPAVEAIDDLSYENKPSIRERYAEYDNKYIEWATDENIDSIRKTSPFYESLIATENDQMIKVEVNLEKDSTGKYKSTLIIKNYYGMNSEESEAFFNGLTKDSEL